jgi:hypothetical protein
MTWLTSTKREPASLKDQAVAAFIIVGRREDFGVIMPQSVHEFCTLEASTSSPRQIMPICKFTDDTWNGSTG